MDEIGKAALTMTPCEICAMLDERRCYRPSEDAYGCGIYAEIIFAQWDATCKLIRERTGKQKKK